MVQESNKIPHRIVLKNTGRYLFDVFDENYKNGNYKIATVELFVNDKYWLNKIQVEYDCLRKHYGTAILEYLIENYKPFRISLSNKNAHNHGILRDTRCLTFEGFQLVKKCFQDDILKREHFEFPYSDISLEYNLDRFLDT